MLFSTGNIANFNLILRPLKKAQTPKCHENMSRRRMISQVQMTGICL